MKIFDKIGLFVEKTTATVATQVTHHRPEIEFWGGAGLVFFGGYLAYKAGKKSEKAGYKKDLDRELKNLDAGITPKSLRNQAKRSSVAKYVFNEAKTVAPAAGCIIVGVLIQKNALDYVKKSNIILEGALASALAASSKFENELIETSGVNQRDLALTNGEISKVDVTSVNSNGETDIYSDTYLVTDIFDLPGEAFIYSKETCINQNFQPNEDYFNSLVCDAEALASRRLHNTHGYCFDDELVKLFSVEPKAIHHTCGSVNPDPKHPYPGDEARTGTLTLYTRKIKIRHEGGSDSDGWLIVPRSDGSIIDIYHKYSLQRLYIKERLNGWGQK